MLEAKKMQGREYFLGVECLEADSQKVLPKAGVVDLQAAYRSVDIVDTSAVVPASCFVGAG